MACHKILRAAAILLFSSLSGVASAAPLKVSVNDLIKNPRKYHGKQVEVIGYWVTSCAHCSDLYQSFEAEQRNPQSENYVRLWDCLRPAAKIPKSFRQALDKSWGNYDGYVRVIGRFNLTLPPDWLGKPISPQPKSAASPKRPPTSNKKARSGLPTEEGERIVVRGWIPVPKNRILKIKLLEPIGPPIPSRIEEYLEREQKKHTVSPAKS